MTLTLPDDPALESIPETELQLDLACGLYASGRVSRNVAARIAGVDRATFDESLFVRNIATFTSAMLAEDMEAMRSLSAE